ncbi:uncharacterized protein BX664DRAFT_377206 [Halteromyces radiatus]|uniref:uncharacterized protein n=1 Tax=Halteromyces radiatus TaxID=101107 RepID=UPI00221F1B4F|nr:uncharacterized protein BX664DRAFT_377206 [Halteromyces radiatus]KAI8099119.1 hypothetical protein BX664DRAFT_377206 [Halteromyces radiatus]
MEDTHQPSISFCVECRDQEASIFCEQCDEDFCEVCHGMLHRTGNRRKHTAKNLKVSTAPITSQTTMTEADTKPSTSDNTSSKEPSMKNGASSSTVSTLTLDGTIINGNGATFGEWMTKRAKHVPLRLDAQERGMLRLLEAALNVSEYTDRIDIISYSNKAKRIVLQIKDICDIISGLLVSGDYKLGARLFAEQSIKENEAFFQRVFEVGRRYKIMNPEKMRSNYGKLMYMLMDSVIPEVEAALGFSCVIPIKTVYDFLKENECVEVLHDDNIALATREIAPEYKTREQVQDEIQRKQLAIESLCKQYSNDRVSAQDIERCLASLSDNHAFLKSNRDPCEKMMKYLGKYYHPSKSESGYSLAIMAGRHGHRLTHTHSSQYSYVHQSLTLWREIVHDMFMLWHLSDEDLTSSMNPYRLTNTGQGLQRIQPCSQVSRAMHKILHRAQKKCGSWVGSSVIHLGDRNVPNAFMFIDKYNQVARILSPIVSTLDKLDTVVKEDEELARYINTMYGSVDQCRKDILHDFFRSGFDGSGADNYFDAGSCIDGRLTSAWNWCSQIEKKPFFPVFLLTGFVGFDGGGW